MKRITMFLFIVLAASAAGAAAGPIHLLHSPAMNRTQIVFSYAGDLWTVSRQGGAAARLTAGAGIESNPVFSPDGATIAFTGEYDGNVDVYTVPSLPIKPRKLFTLHSAIQRLQRRRSCRTAAATDGVYRCFLTGWSAPGLCPS